MRGLERHDCSAVPVVSPWTNSVRLCRPGRLHRHASELSSPRRAGGAGVTLSRLAAIALTFCTLAFSQGGGGRGPQLVSLKQVPIPQPTNAGVYVKDQTSLVVLGKALFWDLQAGSDGKTACA